ncbi:MAG TPA: transposase [Chlamydiales bacterium]|nr:transposase [Chlamydiales bacterium]
MIVVSHIEFENPLVLYRKRWEIETLFGCIKGRGFRMEDTHMVDADKIEKLLFVLVIGFCWAYRTGDIKTQEIPIEIKTHGRKVRSLFREGMNWIRRAIFGNMNLKEFRRLISCFMCSKTTTCVV